MSKINDFVRGFNINFNKEVNVTREEIEEYKKDYFYVNNDNPTTYITYITGIKPFVIVEKGKKIFVFPYIEEVVRANKAYFTARKGYGELNVDLIKWIDLKKELVKMKGGK